VLLKNPGQFTIIGTPRRDVDIEGIVTGATEFGLDTKIPGMLYAVIERAPTFGGRVRTISIPTIRDRVVQGAIRLILAPIFEADFSDSSYGARPGRSAHQAIGLVRQGLHRRKHRVVDVDQLKSALEPFRAAGREVVFTNGCFDILHAGHIATHPQAVHC